MKISVEKMHRPEEVLERIRRAIERKTPLSLIRLASGEAFVLAHNVILPMSQIPWWVDYAGVRLPNETARRDLINAVQKADIVGLSSDHTRWECAPLLEKSFNHYKLNPVYLTSSIVNWEMHKHNALYRIIGKTPTILVGRRATEAAPKLAARGLNIVKSYQLEGYTDLPRVEKAISEGPGFRLAIVAAGIPACILCSRIAKSRGCVAIDYGHVINDLIQPGFNIQKLDSERERWKKEVNYERLV